MGLYASPGRLCYYLGLAPGGLLSTIDPAIEAAVKSFHERTAVSVSIGDENKREPKNNDDHGAELQYL
ncbi:MAG: hypothetical protein AMR96_01365 [Candidatus Adiutrix intracellularis]|nr:MAG: hypothetical protein AMR96_01365 [Candidatus Adiutrix intracellularis]